MMIEDLLLEGQAAGPRRPLVDVLASTDALLESQVLEVRSDLVRGVVGVLFELRTAIELDEANTGLIVARGVNDFHWRSEPRKTLTAWTVLGSRAETGIAGLSFALSCYPDAGLSLRSTSLTYFNVQVSEIGEVPPDYAGSGEALFSSLARWDSHGEVVSSSTLRHERKLLGE